MMNRPITHPRAVICWKKQPGKKRKVVEPEDVVALASSAEPAAESILVAAERKHGSYTTCIRCALALVVSTIGQLTINQMNEVTRLSFGGLLKFNLEGLDRRDLLCFLMDMIDPNEMVLRVCGGRSILVTPHAVKCILGLPCGGRDAPMVPLAVGTAELKRLLGVPPNDNIKNEVL